MHNYSHYVYTAFMLHCNYWKTTHTYTVLTAIFPGQPGSAGCLLDCQSPEILILSILTGQARSLQTHRVLRLVLCPLTLTAIPRGFEAEVFTGRMPFLSPTNSVKALKAKPLRTRVVTGSSAPAKGQPVPPNDRFLLVDRSCSMGSGYSHIG